MIFALPIYQLIRAAYAFARCCPASQPAHGQASRILRRLERETLRLLPRTETPKANIHGMGAKQIPANLNNVDPVTIQLIRVRFETHA